MTKFNLWNPITKFTPLNNFLNNCVITSSYKTIDCVVENLTSFQCHCDDIPLSLFRIGSIMSMSPPPSRGIHNGVPKNNVLFLKDYK
jgi:hypothetical protein